MEESISVETTSSVSLTFSITSDLQWHSLKEERMLFVSGELPGKA